MSFYRRVVARAFYLLASYSGGVETWALGVFRRLEKPEDTIRRMRDGKWS